VIPAARRLGKRCLGCATGVGDGGCAIQNPIRLLTVAVPLSTVPGRMTIRVDFKQLGLAGLLMTMVFSLCGCIYLRLNALRNQLAEFDRFVTVGGEPDLALTFKRPVLWSEDLTTLFKQPPTEQREAGSLKTCLWVVEKERAPVAEDPGAFRFTFTTLFTSNKLSQLVIPRELLRVVPREAAVRMFKAMGRAQVNKGRRRADTQFPTDGKASDQFVCITQDVKRLLGTPQKTQSDNLATTWHYRFVLRPPANHPEPGMSILAQFVFRKTDDRLTSAQVEFSGHQVNVKM